MLPYSKYAASQEHKEGACLGVSDYHDLRDFSGSFKCDMTCLVAGNPNTEGGRVSGIRGLPPVIKLKRGIYKKVICSLYERQ